MPGGQPTIDSLFDQAEASSQNGLNEGALARYPANVQAQARMLANYTLPVDGRMLANPKSVWPAIAEAASEYDPSFNAAQYDTRKALRRDFTSGKSADNVRSLNTAIGHLESLRQAGDQLNNVGLKPANAVINWVENEAGDPRVTNFDTRANAVSSELTKVFRGTSGSESDVKSWRDQLSHNASPDQQHAAIDSAVDLLSSRTAALRDQYEKGMGRPTDLAFLNPNSRKILQGMGYDPDQIEKGSPAADAKAPAQSTITVNTKSDYDKLPSGATYTDSADGKTYRKK